MTERPTLIAHRGYAARYPENTLIALQAAVASGATWLEFDVQLSADRVPVLLHDITLQRCSGQPDAVFDVTAAQLRGHGIPALAEVGAWLANQSGVHACVELKVESIRRFGVEAVLKAVVPAIAAVRDRCVLLSFDDAFLFAARLASPGRIGWVLPEWSPEALRRARALAPDILFVDQRMLPPAPAPLWPGAWRWAVYEVADAAAALALAGRGVEFVETMAIGELLADARWSRHHA